MDTYRHVSKIESIMCAESACTCPLFVYLDDSSLAVFKYLGNPQGDTVLFNEYFSNSIANIIGLRIPEFGVALLDQNTTPHEVGKSISGYIGVGFYSSFLQKTVPASKRALSHVLNIDDTCKMILVDAIVNNTDRYKSNVLVGFQKKDSYMYSIDFSHAFGGADWDSNSLVIGDSSSPVFWRENCEFYETLLTAGADFSEERIKNEVDNIQSKVAMPILDEIIDRIPPEWIPRIGMDQIQHAKKYVLQRVLDLDTIVSTIRQERGYFR